LNLVRICMWTRVSASLCVLINVAGTLVPCRASARDDCVYVRLISASGAAVICGSHVICIILVLCDYLCTFWNLWNLGFGAQFFCLICCLFLAV
jgi:hypothetical protein